MKKTAVWTGLAVLGLMSSGCVTKQTHEATLQELDQARSTLSWAEKKINEQNHQLSGNAMEIDRANADREELAAKKAALQQDLDAAQKRLDAANEKLTASESQLESLRRIEAETGKRNEIYARFVKELQKMIDGGRLTVSIEQGRLVINLPENVLFASGSAALNPGGEEALKQIAGVLQAFSDRRFQVEGHTDNIPIKSSRYPSNWELSSARALNVVHLMVSEGVLAQNVSAAGFGEFHPRADNATEEGRTLNRRIEIIMQPNLDVLSSELPKLES